MLSLLNDLDIVDGHIHLNHLEQIDNIVALMEAGPLLRANLVCTPNPVPINHNPELIAFKARFPDRAYLSGALDYSQVLAEPERMPDALAAQVHDLKAIGFDGLKMTEGKPTKRKWIPISLDAPQYAPFWATVEALKMPVVLHAGDPETYWDVVRCPRRARERGWFYGDGTFPLKEALHAEVVNLLERHPQLKIVLAHFHFLSSDLVRAERLFDTYPNVCFDLAPGAEMINDFTRYNGQARAFFLRYQERLIFGTDTTSGGIARDGDQGVGRALERGWVVRRFLETDRPFVPPDELARWLEPGMRHFRGLALPREALIKIYHTNLERLYGLVPAVLDLDKALSMIERMACALDERVDGTAVDNHARQGLRTLGYG